MANCARVVVAIAIVQSVPVGTGWIEVIAGPMFSGKTEELIRRLRRALYAKQKVAIFKSPEAYACCARGASS